MGGTAENKLHIWIYLDMFDYFRDIVILDGPLMNKVGATIGGGRADARGAQRAAERHRGGRARGGPGRRGVIAAAGSAAALHPSLR